MSPVSSQPLIHTPAPATPSIPLSSLSRYLPASASVRRSFDLDFSLCRGPVSKATRMLGDIPRSRCIPRDWHTAEAGQSPSSCGAGTADSYKSSRRIGGHGCLRCGRDARAAESSGLLPSQLQARVNLLLISRSPDGGQHGRCDSFGSSGPDDELIDAASTIGRRTPPSAQGWRARRLR